jgi:hypothetical protein
MKGLFPERKKGLFYFNNKICSFGQGQRSLEWNRFALFDPKK